MKYLKEFDAHSGYTDFTLSGELLRPNVSYCVNEEEVHYNPIYPSNVIKFTSTEEILLGSYGFIVEGLYNSDRNEFTTDNVVSYSETFKGGVYNYEVKFDTTVSFLGYIFQWNNTEYLTSITLPSMVEGLGDICDQSGVLTGVTTLTLLSYSPPRIGETSPNFNLDN